MAWSNKLTNRDQRLDEALRLAVAEIRDRGSEVTIDDLRVVRWQQTLLNRVFEVCVDKDPTQSTFFVKLAETGMDSDLSREVENMALFKAYFADSNQRFKVVDLVGFYPEVDALVVYGCDGICLIDSMMATSRWLARQVKRDTSNRMAFSLGEWLRSLESRTLGIGKPHEVRNRMIREADTALERLADMGTSAPLRLIEACRQLIRQIECLPECAVYLAHGDLHPGNVFVSENGESTVTVIDLRLARPQFIGYDAMYFEHVLAQSWSLARYNPIAIRGVLDAFRLGYGRRIETGSSVALALRAHLVLASLVYFSTIARNGTPIRKFMSWIDMRSLSSSYNALLVKQSSKGL